MVLKGFERFCAASKPLDGFVMLWEALALDGFGKLLKRLGRLWLQHSMSLTEALGGFGKFWEPLGGCWKLWEALEGFGIRFGRLWKTLEGMGGLWEALVGFGMF